MNSAEKLKQMLSDRFGNEADTMASLKNNPIEGPEPPPYRLELYYDAKNNLILLQGNIAGLKQLHYILERLTYDNTLTGSHWHLDQATNLSDTNTELIIQLVEDSGPGPHVVQLD